MPAFRFRRLPASCSIYCSTALSASVLSAKKPNTPSLRPRLRDGVFPEGFYSTTNLETAVRLNQRWVRVQWPEMDCGIAVDPEAERAWTVALSDVKQGEHIVIGHRGVRVTPLERPRAQPQVFAFMGSSVSSEKPKALLIGEIAQRLREIRARQGRVILVGGPVLVHTGTRDNVASLIREGYVNVIFGGNGLATHDIEMSMFGTSLGVSLTEGIPQEGGHEHHLRAINRVRRAGSIRAAVEQGLISDGIMHACVCAGATYILAGSIRDDGPLPDVVSDTLQAQRLMREEVHKGADLVLVLSSMLHGIATGQLAFGDGDHGMCGYQPRRGDQAVRPRQLSSHRPGHGRRRLSQRAVRQPRSSSSKTWIVSGGHALEFWKFPGGVTAFGPGDS